MKEVLKGISAGKASSLRPQRSEVTPFNPLNIKGFKIHKMAGV